MGNIFLNLLNISITATWFILAIIIFRVVFKKVPKFVNCILWCLVIFRLVLPFSIESPFSFIKNTTPVKSEQFYIETTESNISQKSEKSEVTENSVSDDLVSAKPENKKTINLIEIISVICSIWGFTKILPSLSFITGVSSSPSTKLRAF